MGDTNKAEILTKLFDSKITAILNTLVNSPKEFYLRELAKEANVPPATTYRILQHLTKIKLVEVVKINKFKLYRLSSNENARYISTIFIKKQNALDLFVNQIKGDDKIESIMLHGEPKSDKANVLIIGKIVNTENIDKEAELIRKEAGFEISFVSLDPAQYKKMTSMGLYSGKKTELYSK